MPVTSLTPAEKAEIVHQYIDEGVSQSDLAIRFGVSPRTIYRVLNELGARGAAEVPLSVKMMKILDSHGINDPHELNARLYRPAMNESSVSVFLVNLPLRRFTVLMNAVHRVRQNRAAARDQALEPV